MLPPLHCRCAPPLVVAAWRVMSSSDDGQGPPFATRFERSVHCPCLWASAIGMHLSYIFLLLAVLRGCPMGGGRVVHTHPGHFNTRHPSLPTPPPLSTSDSVFVVRMGGVAEGGEGSRKQHQRLTTWPWRVRAGATPRTGSIGTWSVAPRRGQSTRTQGRRSGAACRSVAD